MEVLSALPDTDTGRPPLLFLHGLGHGAWCFAENWLGAAAEAGYPAYALSYRGHGASGGHTRLRRASLRGYVHDVEQVIAQLPEPPVIIAHSLGTLVAQRVLARYPARAGVLLTPMPASGIRATVLRGLRRRPLAFTRAVAGGTLPLTADDLFADLEPGQAELYASRVGRESPWAQYAMLLPERVGPITCPVLVVGAESDDLIAPSDVERCARDLDAEVMWVPGGHDVMLDRDWRRALEGVLAWVGDVCPAGSAPLPGADVLPPLAEVLTSRT